MRAALIAVGSEMLLPAGREDTNSGWLATELGSVGYDVVARVTVGDDVAVIAGAIGHAIGHADAVLLTGGLGPTEDDRTREALALSLGAPLERDASRVEALRRAFEALGRPFHPEQARQADRPRGFSFVHNPHGTAPGLLAERDGVVIAAMPGVPGEMRAIFEAGLRPVLAAKARRCLETRTLRIAGKIEPEVDRTVRDLYEAPGLVVTILAGRGLVELLARAEGRDAREAHSRLDDFEQEVRRRLGAAVFGTGQDTLASVVGDELRRAGRSLATAESCTGGLLGAALTDVPGASTWYRGGVVVYADELKLALCGVDERTLERHGAVSEAVARELARGARERCRSDLALSMTGIAGPGGGTPDKPVGTVHVGLQDGERSFHRELRLAGSRGAIRQRAVVEALDRLRRHLIGAP